MREIRERQVANSEEQKTSRRHLPSTSKPCGIGYQTRPPLMKRFKAMISGLLGYIKELGIAPATWQRSSPVPLDKGTTKLGPARIRLVHLLCPFGKAFYGDLWRHRPHPWPAKSQHLCIQQRPEERGSHSDPTHGKVETDKGRRARANWYDDDGV